MANNPKGTRTAGGLSRRRKLAQSKEGAEYAERRARIIASAAAAFQEEGYDKTTLNDIAARAGTDRASVYYYASSKEELFEQVCSGMLAANLAAAEEIAMRDLSAPEKLELIMAHHLKTHEDAYPQSTVLVQELRRVTDATTTWSRDEVSRMRRYEAVVRSIIENGVEDGTLRSDIDPELVIHAIFGMLNWTHRWLRPGGRYDSTQVAQAFADIALAGITPAMPHDSHATKNSPAR